MLTPEETKVILNFLDRAPITGHQERNAMNAVVESLHTLLIPKMPVQGQKHDG